MVAMVQQLISTLTEQERPGEETLASPGLTTTPPGQGEGIEQALQAVPEVLPEAEAPAAPAPAETPAGEVLSRAEAESLRKEVAQLRDWRNQQTQAQVQQETQDFQQKLSQFDAAVAKHYEDFGIPRESQEAFGPYLRLGFALSQPSAQAKFTRLMSEHTEGQKLQQAVQLLRSFPPQTTAATLWNYLDELLKMETPGERQRWTTEWTKQQRQRNLRQRVESGAEQVEGGTNIAMGATEFDVLEQKFTRGVGPFGGLSPTEFRRYMQQREARGL